MNAAIGCYLKDTGEYLYKCPTCGVVLHNKPWTCSNCGQVIETYRQDMISGLSSLKVCVDLHGVILDMLGALKDYLKEHEGIDFDPNSVTDYDFNCDVGFDNALIFKAFKDPLLHRAIAPYEGALEGLELLKTRCKPMAYTGVVDNAAIVGYYNSFIRQVGLSGTSMSYKKPVIYDANVLFDDCIGVHRQWYDAGFRGLQYLIDRPYNQWKPADLLASKVIRVKSFRHGVVDLFNRCGWPIEGVV